MFCDLYCYATIGFFDGVHIGHQYVLRQLSAIAREHGGRSLVVTFREHPKTILTGESMPLLTSLEEKTDLLRQAGADEVLVIDFAEVRSLTAQQFMQWLNTEHGVTDLLLGYNHHFGSDHLSSYSDYEAAGREVGVMTHLLEPYLPNQQDVSSTIIRRLLVDGRVEEANALLGYEYSLTGTVVHGRGIGRSIGFPTANLSLDSAGKLLPADGVYAARVKVRGCYEPYLALLNIGTNPTVGGTGRSIEAHILNLDADLYGSSLSLSIQKKVRSERTFASLDDLRKQIANDILISSGCYSTN